MPNPNTNPDADMELIDRLLAGTISPGERRVLEERMAREPELAREVQAQTALQASLRASMSGAFPEPQAAQVDAMLARAHAEAQRPPWLAETLAKLAPGMPVAKVIPIAAAALVLIAGLVLIPRLAGGGRPPEALVLVAPGDQFAPTTPVQDAQELEALVAEKLGIGASFPQREGVRYLGVRTDLGSSPMGLMVLAEVDGQGVVLSLERAGDVPDAPERTQPSAREAGVFVHERTLLRVRLTEYSRSATPLLGDVRVIPDQP